MYQEIYDKFIHDLKAKRDFRLLARRLNLGGALRQIRKDRRIKMRHFLQKTGLNRNAVNSIIQVGEINTTQEKIEKIVSGLDIPLEEFVKTAREMTHYNFHLISRDSAPVLKFKNYEIEIYSPPLFNPRDFLWCLVRIYPRENISIPAFASSHFPCLFVVNGHLKMKYGHKTFEIHSNQSAIFDSSIPHEFENDAKSGTTDFYLLYQLPPLMPKSKETRGRKPVKGSHMLTAELIRQIRKEISPKQNRPISNDFLSSISGIDINALNHIQYHNPKIIPFETIDRLSNLTNYTFEHIVEKAQNRYQGQIHIFTDEDKSRMDLKTRFGAELVNVTGFGSINKRYSIYELRLEAWRDLTNRKIWSYEGQGYMGLKVERGILGIEYGNQPLKTLHWGDTVYFDTSIKTSFLNLLTIDKARELQESDEVKATLFSSSPMV